MTPKGIAAGSAVDSCLSLVKYGEQGLELPPGLPFDDWKQVGEALLHMESHVHWWLGDWWAFGEREYGEAASQAAPTGFALKTVQNAAYVAGRVEPSRRREDLTFTHHSEVAGLPAAQADALLARAEAESLPTRELRQEVRRVRHEEKMGVVTKNAPGLADMGRFPIILADPPWRFEHSEETRAIENNYETMATQDICELKVPAAPDAMLFLWSPSAKLPEAVEVISAWGFDYRTSLVWVKPSIGPGHYVRCRHEFLLVAMKGELPAPLPRNRPDSIVEAPRGRHSVKPEAVYSFIDKAYPKLPKVEMFARGPVPSGWTAWGDQA